MRTLVAFREIPRYAAVLMGLIISFCLAVGAGLGGAYLSDFVIEKFSSTIDGPGLGVLVILIAVNVAVPAFIATFTVAVNLHRRTSWRTPVFAFIASIGLIRILGAFDIQFAPFMLSTGALACLISCWLLHRKGNRPPKDVVET